MDYAAQVHMVLPLSHRLLRTEFCCACSTHRSSKWKPSNISELLVDSEDWVGVVWVIMQFGRDVDVSIRYIYRHNLVRNIL